MNTRQLRLSDPDQIKKRMSEFIGKKVNIVLHDSMVFFGTLYSTSEKDIVVTTMRLKKITLAITNISELFIDTPS